MEDEGKKGMAERSTENEEERKKDRRKGGKRG